MTPDPIEPDPTGPVIACVGAVVLDGASSLLLVRRRDPPGAGLWSLPGGRVEPGEDDAAAVAREVAEETGLAVTVGPLVGRVRRDAPGGGSYDIRDHTAVPVGSPGSPGPVVAPPLTPGDDAGDARWVDPAAYAAMDAAGELVAGLTAALRDFGVWDR